MRALLAALFVATAFAGCSEDAPGVGDPLDGESMADRGLAVPTWAVGDYWVYETTFGVWTLVVTEDSGADWIVDTTEADLSFFSAAFGEISYLGAVRKADLAGSQGSDRVQFMSFPLTDGKTWRTMWDQEEHTMVAARLDDARYEITGSIGDDVRKRVVYNNATEWFESIVFFDATGTEFGRMSLTTHGSGFTGEVVRVTPQLIDERHFTATAAPYFTTYSWSGAEDADAYIVYSSSCATGSFTFALGTVQALTNAAAELGVFEDQGFSEPGTVCPHGIQFSGTIGESPEIDTWGALFVSASPDLQLDFSLWLRHMQYITL
jgi:hypothetical protein